MAPADENSAKEQPPPEKTPETTGAATQQPELPDPAQGSKRSGIVLDEGKIWDEFAATLGNGTGEDANFTFTPNALRELVPQFEAFKAKRQRTVSPATTGRIIVGPFPGAEQPK